MILASNSRGKSSWVIVNRSEKQSKKNFQKRGKFFGVIENDTETRLSNGRISFLYIAN